MTHLLVDVDSKIPNLALMKISQYVKDKGRTLLRLNEALRERPLDLDPEKVWISCVFTWNRKFAQEWASHWRVPVEIGGSGISLKTRLPDEIEQLIPDYDLYGDDRAIGFAQRGCIRKCSFCIVPLKEGRLIDNQYHPLEQWVPEGFSKVLLLDNEFAACPYEQQVLETCQAHDWKLSITQGYDLRCVTEQKAGWLADWKPWNLGFTRRTLYCAWDYLGIEPYVRKGIDLLQSAGFRGSEIMCYCLVGFNTSHLQDYYRFHVLWKEYGVLPFLMRYNKRTDDRFLNALSRFVNRGPAIYRYHSFIQYCEQEAPSLLRETTEIVNTVESGQPIPLDIPYQMPQMKSQYD